MEKSFTIHARKLTGEDLMREACETTFSGKSGQSLEGMYKSEHSPSRTQLFWIRAEGIPLFVATHLLRHHVGSVPFQLTCREDRNGANPGLARHIDDVIRQLDGFRDGGGNMESAIGRLEWLKGNSDRRTPVSLGLLLNAQSLIDMSKLRLCSQAHRETTAVFQEIKNKISSIDPALAAMMVRKCVYRGGVCGEPRCCGFNHTQAFAAEFHDYISHFSAQQNGTRND